MIEVFSQSVRIFGSEGGIGALGVDVKELILQAATFLIVFLLLKKFAFDKIGKALEKRQETINKGVELGISLQKEQTKLEERVEELLKKARIKADKIIAAAHTESGEMLKDAEARASRKVDAMIADAHLRIEEDIKRARKDLEHETLALVAEATEVIMREKLDAKKDATLIERALGGLR